MNESVKHLQTSPIERPLAAPSIRSRAFKRLLDVSLASMGLLLSAPLLLACAVWIKCRNPGPAFYRQWRVGRNGRLFIIHKLRTMRLDAERGRGAICAAPGDARIIPGCAWMRRSHVDELPQLWNILMGQMSVVGPRPERPEIIRLVASELPDFETRLIVKPGLTGLAQLKNGYANDVNGLRRKLEYDLQYIAAMSSWKDLKLIFQTLPRVWDQAAH